MLDLSNAITAKYYEIRLLDGTELQLNRPTQAMIECIISLNDLLTDKGKELEAIKGFTHLFTAMLNRNVNGKRYKAEELADEYDFTIIGIAVKDYFTF